MINSEIKNLPKSEIQIKITVAWDNWKKFIDEAVKLFAKEVKVQGFRDGKAPRNLIEQKVGKHAILEEAANLAIKKTYEEVVKEKKLDVIGAPKAKLVTLEEDQDLVYEIVTAVVPVAEIGAWQDKVKKTNAKFAKEEIKVEDAEIDKEIEQIANGRVQLVDVDREAKNDDNVMIDFEVKRGGVPIEHGTSKNHPLVLGRGVFIPGFEENVVGMKAGEEKEFELNFPEDYHDKEIAGKPATFSVKVNLVQERKTPEVSDEFARSLGKFADLAELKKNVEDGMLEEKQRETKEKRRAEMVEILIDAVKVELPEVLVHEELHKMLGEFDMQLQGMGMNLDVYLEQIKKTKDDLETEWHTQAERRVKAALALEEVAKKEEIQVSNEEVEAEMNKTLQQYKGIKDVEKNIDLGRLYNYLRGTLQNEKVFELMENLK
jgi:trigger factor